MNGKLSVVVGGQYGSEAKGHVAGWLARHENNDPDRPAVWGIRTGGPNAGHSAYDLEQRKWALRQIPVIAVTNYHARLVIAQGSEIDPEVLRDEITRLENAGIPIKHRLIVDRNATILEPRHREAEAADGLVGRVGSTGKGIGAARADRLMRKALRVADVADSEWFEDLVTADTPEILRGIIKQGAHAIIEGTQGYGLGLHGKHYPQCTSGDVRATDLIAAVGLSSWDLNLFNNTPDVWVVLRVYPIRVAGNSGYLQDETTWEDLGLPEEYTTVTKKVRRVGHWDADLAREAVAANGGTNVRIALTMVDQKIPGVAGKRHQASVNDEDHKALYDLVNQVETDTGARVTLVGTGPDTMMRF